jgi:hypothetical protein
MKTNDLPELAARITAPMRTTGGRAFLEIIPPTLDLLARGKPASPEEIAATSAKSPEEVRAGRLTLPHTLRTAGEHRVSLPRHRRSGALRGDARRN